nr:MAG TPA: hypothetical protein [Caudoviricetes sp.]DAZ17792.1 MAG TPA: hypothetical protein [Caudoviricetes sp.]
MCRMPAGVTPCEASVYCTNIDSTGMVREIL